MGGRVEGDFTKRVSEEREGVCVCVCACVCGRVCSKFSKRVTQTGAASHSLVLFLHILYMYVYMYTACELIEIL